MKCFKLLLSNSNVMSLAEAKSRCNRVGSLIANIYSKTHDDLVVDKIKEKRKDPSFIFVGMTYNASVSAVVSL